MVRSRTGRFWRGSRARHIGGVSGGADGRADSYKWIALFNTTLGVVIATIDTSIVLIIWLQGIWHPHHGYSFSSTPLWAGISLLPLTAGFLLAGPVSGILSDRYGSRPCRHRRHAGSGGEFR